MNIPTNSYIYLHFGVDYTFNHRRGTCCCFTAHLSLVLVGLSETLVVKCSEFNLRSACKMTIKVKLSIVGYFEEAKRL